MSEELSFDQFVNNMHQAFDSLPDYRKHSPNLRYSVKDAALGAFAMFFSQSPSFLAHQKAMRQAKGHDNAQSLFGMEQIPCDNQIRNIIDPIDPQLLYPLFSDVFDKMDDEGHLDEYRFFKGHIPMPIDGTEYFRSSKIHCPNCSTARHKNGKITYSHKVLTPVVVAPGNSKVIALEPEFVLPQDGNDKQDCELNAAKRWIKRNAHLSARKIIVLGDDLFSRDPFCKLLMKHGFRFVLVCKRDSHKTLYEWVDSFEKTNDINSFSVKLWNGRFHAIHTYRYMNQLPVKDGEDALFVNWLELTTTRADTGEVIYRNAFITDFSLNRADVPSLAQAGKARWKVENENNNVLKTKGYHLEHNYGHGEQYLSATLLVLNLLAFLAHTFLDFADREYRAVREALSARKVFFHDFATLTKYFFFKNWRYLMSFMFEQLELGRKKPS